jgi:hypothetical protein
MSVHYSYDQNGRFVVTDFNRAKPFSSFMPGIAGLMGKPLWLFYVNRGQGIASFGVDDKDGAIMEFYPANKSYQLVPYSGFRTFIKEGNDLFEPFAANRKEPETTERMIISPSGLELEYEDRRRQLEVRVSYYTMPNEPFAALVRKVSVRNCSSRSRSLELLDGLPCILPYGLGHREYKELGHTLTGWMEVLGVGTQIPHYRLRASTKDTVEVSDISGCHFYASFVWDGLQEITLAPIVDPKLIFGQNTSLGSPDAFYEHSLEELQTRKQVTTNQVPCGFSGVSRVWEPDSSIELYSVVGHVKRMNQLQARAKELLRKEYLEAKQVEAVRLVEELTAAVHTETAEPIFDAYCRQSYLDNMLRGGFPIQLQTDRKRMTYHVYSRKHGDLERDYNFFYLRSSYYSQGNGNFRDVNQNRRNDTWFHPEVEDFNIRLFMSLIQADGYNPLVVKGSSFLIQDSEMLKELVVERDWERVRTFLSKPFAPGDLLAFIEDWEIELLTDADEFMLRGLEASEQWFEADFGEGYWIDHWTYCLDLIESFLSIYPERKESLLFGNKQYMYYDSPALVQPRSEKYVLVDGRVRQLGAVVESKTKELLLEQRGHAASWLRTRQGHGDIYRTDLYEKLLLLALIKAATLDPEGLGIEMEANKPGWNDSLNGLPGLFASGFSELCELKRLLLFLLSASDIGPSQISLPEEIADLLQEASHIASVETVNPLAYWEAMSSAREGYRMRVAYGFTGDTTLIERAFIEQTLGSLLSYVTRGIRKAFEIGHGVYPTYFYYEVTRYEPLKDDQGAPRHNDKGHQHVQALEFRRIELPYFLEGPTRAMKVIETESEKQKLYLRLKSTDVYDSKLQMYKVNAPLSEQSKDIGRARAFTPGWLENESVFLHMSYKYVLELLKAGLYDLFFDEIQRSLVPFMKPEVYGRSILENSSFIASSANPDEGIHGTGFVARLSGSTAEFLSMWNLMMWGKAPFLWENGELCLRLRPALPPWLFDSSNQIRTTFLGSIKVTYTNPERLPTYGPNAAAITEMRIYLKDGREVFIPGDTIPSPLALAVRNREAARIEVSLLKPG